jgi:protoheme ferro-lyase
LQELEKFDLPEEVEIFFSAHGVPVSYVELDGDPYKEEMEQCVRMVMERLRNRGVSNSHTLAYQSRVGPVSPIFGPLQAICAVVSQDNNRVLIGYCYVQFCPLWGM